jgi:hypothetical protein
VLTLAVKPQWVRCKLDETIEQSCSHFLAHTLEVCKGAMLMLAVKPQWVHCKLDETIEQSCCDFLAHTLEVCKGARRYNEYSAIQG